MLNSNLRSAITYCTLRLVCAVKGPPKRLSIRTWLVGVIEGEHEALVVLPQSWWLNGWVTVHCHPNCMDLVNQHLIFHGNLGKSNFDGCKIKDSVSKLALALPDQKKISGPGLTYLLVRPPPVLSTSSVSGSLPCVLIDEVFETLAFSNG